MTTVEKRRASRKSHRKHNDGGYSDTETDREVSSLTDRAFRSLCIGDEAVYNDADLSASPCAQRDRQLAISHNLQEREDEERQELKRTAHESFSLRVQQYGQDWNYRGMFGAEFHKDQQWAVSGERGTQGRLSATFQQSFVAPQQAHSSRDLSLYSNGTTEVSSQPQRSHSRVSSLVHAFNSDRQREETVYNNETSWDKSALMSIERELSEFSSYPQNMSIDYFPPGGLLSAQNYYSSEVAAISHMNSASSFMRSTQANCNSNFFIHSEFSPFKVWRDHSRFPFHRGQVSGFVPCAEFQKWYETPMYKELSLQPQQHPSVFADQGYHRNTFAPAVPMNPQRSTSASSMIQRASSVEKRCESVGHYRKRAQSTGANRLPPQRPSTASPSSEMSRQVKDTISSVKSLQQKIKMMAEQNLDIQSQGGFYNNYYLNPYAPMVPNMVSSNLYTAPYQMQKSPVYAPQEWHQQPHSVSPQPVEHAPVRAESRGATPDIKMSSYKSRAASLLYNLKDNRKRVKATYSPSKFKGFDSQEKYKQEQKDFVIDVPEFQGNDLMNSTEQRGNRLDAGQYGYQTHSPRMLQNFQYTQNSHPEFENPMDRNRLNIPQYSCQAHSPGMLQYPQHAQYSQPEFANPIDKRLNVPPYAPGLLQNSQHPESSQHKLVNPADDRGHRLEAGPYGYQAHTPRMLHNIQFPQHTQNMHNSQQLYPGQNPNECYRMQMQGEVAQHHGFTGYTPEYYTNNRLANGQNPYENISSLTPYKQGVSDTGEGNYVNRLGQNAAAQMPRFGVASQSQDYVSKDNSKQQFNEAARGEFTGVDRYNQLKENKYDYNNVYSQDMWGQTNSQEIQRPGIPQSQNYQNINAYQRRNAQDNVQSYNYEQKLIENYGARPQETVASTQYPPPHPVNAGKPGYTQQNTQQLPGTYRDVYAPPTSLEYNKENKMKENYAPQDNHKYYDQESRKQTIISSQGGLPIATAELGQRKETAIKVNGMKGMQSEETRHFESIKQEEKEDEQVEEISVGGQDTNGHVSLQHNVYKDELKKVNVVEERPKVKPHQHTEEFEEMSAKQDRALPTAEQQIKMLQEEKSNSDPAELQEVTDEQGHVVETVLQRPDTEQHQEQHANTEELKEEAIKCELAASNGEARIEQVKPEPSRKERVITDKTKETQAGAEHVERKMGEERHGEERSEAKQAITEQLTENEANTKSEQKKELEVIVIKEKLSIFEGQNSDQEKNPEQDTDVKLTNQMCACEEKTKSTEMDEKHTKNVNDMQESLSKSSLTLIQIQPENCGLDQAEQANIKLAKTKTDVQETLSKYNPKQLEKYKPNKAEQAHTELAETKSNVQDTLSKYDPKQLDNCEPDTAERAKTEVAKIKTDSQESLSKSDPKQLENCEPNKVGQANTVLAKSKTNVQDILAISDPKPLRNCEPDTTEQAKTEVAKIKTDTQESLSKSDPKQLENCETDKVEQAKTELAKTKAELVKIKEKMKGEPKVHQADEKIYQVNDNTCKSSKEQSVAIPGLHLADRGTEDYARIREKYGYTQTANKNKTSTPDKVSEQAMLPDTDKTDEIIENKVDSKLDSKTASTNCEVISDTKDGNEKNKNTLFDDPTESQYVYSESSKDFKLSITSNAAEHEDKEGVFEKSSVMQDTHMEKADFPQQRNDGKQLCVDEYKLPQSNLPNSGDKRTVVKWDSCKVKEVPVEKVDKSDIIQHKDLTKNTLLEKKAKSSDQNTATSKETSLKGLAHKEKAQTKQEILTSKIKAHAEKEISAIKEGFAIKEGLKNPTKPLSVSQNVSIRQKPPSQEVNKKQERALDSDTSKVQSSPAAKTIILTGKSAELPQKQVKINETTTVKSATTVSLASTKKPEKLSVETNQEVRCSSPTHGKTGKPKHQDKPLKQDNLDKGGQVKNTAPSLKLSFGQNESSGKEDSLEIMGIMVTVRERKPLESNEQESKGIQEIFNGKCHNVEKQGAASIGVKTSINRLSETSQTRGEHYYNETKNIKSDMDSKTALESTGRNHTTEKTPQQETSLPTDRPHSETQRPNPLAQSVEPLTVTVPAKNKLLTATQPVPNRQDIIAEETKEYANRTLNAVPVTAGIEGQETGIRPKHNLQPTTEMNRVIPLPSTDNDEKTQEDNLHIDSIAIRVLPVVTEEVITTGTISSSSETSKENVKITGISANHHQESFPSNDDVQKVLSSVRKQAQLLKNSNKQIINNTTKNIENDQSKEVYKTLDETKKPPIEEGYFQVEKRNNEHIHTEQTQSNSKTIGQTPNAVSQEGDHPKEESLTEIQTSSSANKALNTKTLTQINSTSNDNSNKDEKPGASHSHHTRRQKADRQRGIANTQNGTDSKDEVKPKPKVPIPEISALADYARLKVIVSKDNEDNLHEMPPNKKEGFFPLIQTRPSRRPVFTLDSQEDSTKEKPSQNQTNASVKVSKEPKHVVFPITDKQHQRTGMFKLGDKETKEAKENNNSELQKTQENVLVQTPQVNKNKEHNTEEKIKHMLEKSRATLADEEKKTAQREEEQRAREREAIAAQIRERRKKQREADKQEEERNNEEVEQHIQPGLKGKGKNLEDQQKKAPLHEQQSISELNEQQKKIVVEQQKLLEEQERDTLKDMQSSTQEDNRRKTTQDNHQQEMQITPENLNRDSMEKQHRKPEEQKKHISEDRQRKSAQTEEQKLRFFLEEQQTKRSIAIQEQLKKALPAEHTRKANEHLSKAEDQKRAILEDKQQKTDQTEELHEEQQNRVAKEAQLNNMAHKEQQKKSQINQDQKTKSSLEEKQRKGTAEEQLRKSTQQSENQFIEQQSKAAVNEEHKVRSALLDEQKKAVAEEQLRKAAFSEEQRRKSIDEQRKIALKEEQRRAALEEQNRTKRLPEEQKRKAAEEQQRLATQIEKQRQQAAYEEHLRKITEEEQKRKAIITEEQKKKGALEEQRWLTLEEQKRKIAQEEQKRKMDEQEQQRKAVIIEEQKKKTALEEQRKMALKEEHRRAILEEQQRNKKIAEEEQRKAAIDEEERKIAQEQRQAALNEEKIKQAAYEEQLRKMAEEDQKRKAAIIEEQKRAALDEQQRKHELEQQQRKSTQEEQKQKAALVEQQRKLAPEEPRKKPALEEQQRKMDGQEQQRKAAIIEEQKKKTALDEHQRKHALELQQRKSTQEEQKQKAALEEKQRKLAPEEQRRKTALEEQQRKMDEQERQRKAAIIEEQKKKTALEELRKMALKEEQRRAILEEQQRNKKIAEEEQLRTAAIEEERRKAALIEENRKQAAHEEHLRKMVEEERKRKAAIIEEQKKSAALEEQRKHALEQQQRKSAQEDQKKKATLEEQQRKLTQEEQQRKTALEEQQRKMDEQERQRKAALIEEHKKKTALEEQRKMALKEEQRRAFLEEQQRNKKIAEEQRRKAATEEQQRKAAREQKQAALIEENRKQAAYEEQLRKTTEEEQKKTTAIIEEQKKRAALEEQQRKLALEEQQRKTAQEEQKQKVALKEEQRKMDEQERERKAVIIVEQKKRATLEEQQRMMDLKEEQRGATLEKQQAKAAEEQRNRAIIEEQRRQATHEEQLRKVAEEEQQLKAAKTEEQKKRLLIEERQRRMELEEQQRKTAQENQMQKVAQKEQQRKMAEEEQQRKLAIFEEQKRKAALEEQQQRKTAVIEEEKRRAALEEQQRRTEMVEQKRKDIQTEKQARQEEDERQLAFIREERIRRQIEEAREAQLEHERRRQQDQQKTEQSSTEARSQLDKQKPRRKENEEDNERQTLKDTEVFRKQGLPQKEMDISARQTGNQGQAAEIEEQKNVSEKTEALQYYSLTSVEVEKPSPPQKRSNTIEVDSNRPLAPVSPSPSLPRSSSVSPAFGTKPSMFKVKDNTGRAYSLTRSIKPRFHKNFGEEFRVGSPMERSSEKNEEDQVVLRYNAGTPVYPEKSPSTPLPEYKPFSRRSFALDEEDCRSVISNMSDVESFATSAADLADIRALYDSDRPESACSFSSDVSRSVGKPPVVPPKSEKALRRAKRLATRRIRKETTKEVTEDSEEASMCDAADAVASPHFASPISIALAPPAGSSVSSSHSHLRSYQATPLAAAPVSLPTASSNTSGPVSVSSSQHGGSYSTSAAPKSVPQVPSSPTFRHVPKPVTQYQVESGFSQSYTQRRVMQDIGSGQYYVVDVPVEVKTKTFFDPETGKYVQLNVRESNRNTTQRQPLQGYPQPHLKPKIHNKPQPTPSAKADYQGYHSYPKGYQSAATSSAPAYKSMTPETITQDKQPVRSSMTHQYGSPETEHSYSPDKTPYMDTVNNTEKERNVVYSTHGSPRGQSEGGNRLVSRRGSRDIITMSELEDFMEVSDW